MTSGDSTPLTLAIVNPAADNAAYVYVNQKASLTLNLKNNTGEDLTLTSQGQISTLKLFPPDFYTDSELEAILVSAVDWTPKFIDNPGFWTLTYAGPDAALWENNTNIDIAFADALASAQPGTGEFQINPSNLGTPPFLQVPGSVALLDPPAVGNAPLELALSLDSQGSVYVSPTNDPLPNTLFLNIKNTGSTDVYEGADPWPKKPKVKVSFVYGKVAGALAPNDKGKGIAPVGSAWGIKGAISIGTGWTVTDPPLTANDPYPEWILEPTELRILGTGAEANITFSFSKITSFTPPGHTQMFVLFTGFYQTPTRAYNDKMFVVDIAKQSAPPTRGLVKFYGDKPLATIFNPSENVSLNLNWDLFSVPRVRLLSSIPGSVIQDFDYHDVDPINYIKNIPVTIPGVTRSTAVIFTMQAFDGNWNYLNSLQFTVFIRAEMFIDPSGQVYPGMQVGKVLWMAANYSYDAPNSYVYEGSNSPAYGRLYTIDAAKEIPSRGWRFPTKEDWAKLIEAYGGGSQAYAGLTSPTGFNAQLGGYRDDMAKYSDLTFFGFYWTSSEQSPGSYYYVQFNGSKKSVSQGAYYQGDFAISLRYVKDL
jgi:uncharacterized protein (TIGR02145 family)